MVSTRSRSRMVPELTQRDRQVLISLFAFDRRSLAVLRIGIAVLLIYSAFFGYLSPSGPLATPDDGIWAVLRLALVPAGLMLMIGYRTRLAAVLCWLIYSHAIRTSFFTPGAPVPFESYVLVLVLFWGMFLPLGDRASVDAHRSGATSSPRFLSVAGAGLMTQVFFIYFSAGVTKDLSEWILRPTALLDVLSNPSHGSQLGQALTRYPEVLAVLSVLTVVIEIIFPILLLVPGKSFAARRTALVAVFVGFHIMLALLMELGIFPYVMMVVWCAFLPSEFWDRLSHARYRNAAPDTEVDRRRVVAVIATAALSMVVLSNLTTWAYFPAQSGLPGLIQEVARAIPLYQQWTMFSVPSTL